MMWYWGTGMHWWGWMLGLTGMILFWGVMIWGIWYVITTMVSPTRDDQRDHGDHRDDGDRRDRGARRTLDERLARGDIDPEEYRRLRDLIEESSPPLVGSGDRR